MTTRTKQTIADSVVPTKTQMLVEEESGDRTYYLKTTSQFRPESVDCGSDGKVYRPNPDPVPAPDIEYILGDCGAAGENLPPTTTKVLVVTNMGDPPVVKAPRDYQQIGWSKPSFWAPVPPDGYVACGHIAVDGSEKPTEDNSPGINKLCCIYDEDKQLGTLSPDPIFTYNEVEVYQIQGTGMLYAWAKYYLQLVAVVVSQAAPEEGQSARSSGDFSTDSMPDGTERWLFEIKNTRYADKIRFDVMEDSGVPLQIDATIWQGVTNDEQESTNVKKYRSLYIANPEGANSNPFEVWVYALVLSKEEKGDCWVPAVN